MKKFFFVAALSAAVLSSCSKNAAEAPVAADDNAIAFSAYTPEAATKGSIVAPASVASVGVFAFYQPAVNGIAQKFNSTKYPTPDFMYNQEVAVADGSYSPVKYWPNNPNDKVSFFAYAPYVADKAWEDMGIKTNANGGDLTVNFPIYESVKDQVDYLYAAPVLDQSKQTIGGKVTFNFAHITSQVSLMVGVEQDKAEQEPTAWDDANTEIKVNSVTLKALGSNIVYKNNTPSVTGSQDIVLTSENFVPEAALINSTNYAVAGYKQLTTTADYMFLAPQTLSKIIVNYTVTTTDEDSAANSSVITNNIEAPLTTALEAGKAYKIKILIGMTSVKFAVTAADWATGTEEQVDVPANNE